MLRDYRCSPDGGTVSHGLRRLLKSVYDAAFSRRPARRRRGKRSSTEVLEDRTLLAAELIQIEDAIPGGGINNSSLGSQFYSAIEENGTPYFFQLNVNSEFHLWRINVSGIAEPVPFAETVPGYGKHDFFNTFPWVMNNGGTLYFAAAYDTKETKLWRINGAGKAEVVDSEIGPGIWSTPGSGEPGLVFDFNGTHYFSARNTASRRDLWRVTGNAVERVAVERNRKPGGLTFGDPHVRISDMTSVGKNLFFFINSTPDDSELWWINDAGNAASFEFGSTFEVEAGLSSPWNFVRHIEFNGALYCIAQSYTNEGRLLRILQGGAVELLPGRFPLSGNLYDNMATQFISDGRTLYLSHRNGLYRINSSGVPTLVEDNIPGGRGIGKGNSDSLIDQMRFVGSTLFFTADNGTDGRELWRINANRRAEMVEDSIPGGGIASGAQNLNVSELKAAGSTLYFTMFGGQGLWQVSTSGIAEPVKTATDNRRVTVGKSKYEPDVLTSVGDSLYFPWSDGVSGQELWTVRSGENARLVEVSPGGGGIEPGLLGSSPNLLRNLNGTLYFAASDSFNGQQMWRVNSQGAAEMIEDSIPGGGLPSRSRPSYPEQFINVNGTLYFSAFDSVNGLELRRLNAAGVAEIIEDSIPGGGINPGVASSIPSGYTPFLVSPTVAGGVLYFVAQQESTGFELWMINPAGFAQIVDAGVTGEGIRPGKESAGIGDLTVANNRLYFHASDGVNGEELWMITDNGQARMVEDAVAGGGIAEDAAASEPQGLTVVNDRLYFTATSAASGRELWRVTDAGIAELVQQKSDAGGISTGNTDSNPQSLTNISGTLYFSASPSGLDTRLMRIDRAGVPEVVRTVSTSQEGASTSAVTVPEFLTNAGGTLYFRAADENGSELWRVNYDGFAEMVEDSIAGGGINPGAAGSRAEPHVLQLPDSELITVNERLYFQANDGSNGMELWFINDAGIAQMVEDTIAGGGIAPGAASSKPIEFSQANGTLYFVATGSAGYPESWFVGSSGIASRVEFEIDDSRITPEIKSTLLPGNAVELGNDVYLSFVYNWRHYMVVRGTDGVWRDANLVDATSAGNTITSFYRPIVIDRVTYVSATDSKDDDLELWKLNPSDDLRALTLSNSRVTENARTGTVVGELAASSFDETAKYTFRLMMGSGSEDSDLFAIAGRQLKTKTKFNAEFRINYAIHVIVTDSKGRECLRRLELQIQDINEPPASIQLSERRITENLPCDSVVGILSTTDPDVTGSFMYSLAVGNGDTDNAAFRIVGSELRAIRSLSLAEQGTFLIRVRSTDQGGLSQDKRFAISVLGQMKPTSASESYTVSFSPAGCVVTVRVAGTPDLLQRQFSVDDTVHLEGLELNDRVLVTGTTAADAITWMGDGLVMNRTRVELIGRAQIAIAGGKGNDAYYFDTDSKLGAVRLDEYDNEGVDLVDFSSTDGQSVSLILWSSQPQVVNKNLRLVLAYGGFENVYGGAGDDNLTGNHLDNILIGNSGNDQLNGFKGDDVLTGGTGDDIYYFSGYEERIGQIQLNEALDGGLDTLDFSRANASVTLNLGVGTAQTIFPGGQLTLGSVDAFENIVGSNGFNTLTGNSADNLIIGGFGNDQLSGGGGDDRLIGGWGNDVYHFGPAEIAESDYVREMPYQGYDTISFSAVLDDVTMNLKSTTTQLVHENRLLRLNSAIQFENVNGGQGDDVLTGNAVRNILEGDAGNDRLEGAEGDDELYGGSGSDIYSFRSTVTQEYDEIYEEGVAPGADTLDFHTILTSVSLDLSQASASTQAVHANRSLYVKDRSAIENVTGGAAGDSLKGNKSDNVIIGNGGNDRIQGEAGNDVLSGGAGSDWYVFETIVSEETDTVIETSVTGSDTLDFELLRSSVTVNLNLATDQHVHAFRSLRLTSPQYVENITGGFGDDMLIGNGRSNTLVGNAGLDRLYGLMGRDLLIGGMGSDELWGGSDDDILIAGQTASGYLWTRVDSIRVAWTSSQTYALRVHALRSVEFGVQLKAPNVIGDGRNQDRLIGGGDFDWFLAAKDDTIADFITGELLDQI